MAASRRLRSRRAAATERRFLKPHESKPTLIQERWRLIVRGQVQGVGYRASCCGRAKDLGLSGWVRNRSDGSVEVEAEGPTQELTELRLWCEMGPSAASVNSVSVSQIGTTGSDWFEVRR
ncbi:MAG: acylphosphatase [Synechococcaceae bacterium WB9_2_170]|nr:acylphosphatase [Synechococcaceae bacterium WB9_2_170]